MRLVDYDPDQIEMPARTATVIASLFDAADNAERSAIIGNNQTIWAEVRAQLRDVFHRKCWYTEAPQQGTDVDVDHFRPKKRIAETKLCEVEHEGYWWLSFSPANYRYSCIVSNRRRKDIDTGVVGGKSDHFPLFDESHRAMSPDCDCDEEEPELIDPCKAEEVAFLTFNASGEAMARHDDSHTKAAKCAKTSITYYHLNHSDFVHARIDLRDKMNKLVVSAKSSFSKLDSGDAFHRASYASAIRDLRAMIQVTAPYSSFCLAFLDRLRHHNYLAGVFI